MEPKRIEKQQALRLRKQGYSLGEISFSLNVSQSTASLWLKHVTLGKRAQARLQHRRQAGVLKSNLVRRNRTRALLDEAAHSAFHTLSHISKTKYLSRLYCSLLYWCEGEKSKNDRSLLFTNSDPLLVSAFLMHLRNGYNLDEAKFRVCIHLHDYHNPEKQLLFWSRATTIPLAQFIRPYKKAHSGKNIRTEYAGCASVRYHDVKIARQVLGLARAFLREGL